MQENQQMVEVEENAVYIVKNGELMKVADPLEYGDVVIKYQHGQPMFCDRNERVKLK